MRTTLFFLMTFTLLTYSCTRNKKVTESTKTTQVFFNPKKSNNYISFDSLKVKYKNGDKIIINDWLLIGPKDFFDSVSTDKNSFKTLLLEKDSAILKYGLFGSLYNFYELKVPTLDALPSGAFIDKKVLKYLKTNEDIFYFVDGAPCESYSSFINRITNKRINYISDVDPKSAMAVWGIKYGKNGALIVNTNKDSEAQKMFKPFSPTSICNKIIPIDSAEYFSKKIRFKKFDDPSTIKKVGGIITIPLNNSTLVFRDDTINVDNWVEYRVVGQDLKKRITLIEETVYNQARYYLINQTYNKIDTLADNPMIFGNKLLCLEGSYTDSPLFIEVWELKNDKLELIIKFSLRSCEIFPDEIYLRGDTLFVNHLLNKYFKLKIF